MVSWLELRLLLAVLPQRRTLCCQCSSDGGWEVEQANAEYAEKHHAPYHEGRDRANRRCWGSSRLPPPPARRRA